MVTAACYCSISLNFTKGKFNKKSAALSQCAVCLYLAVMGFYHGLHITQSESKSFHIMYVTGMGPVKTLEDPFQGIPVHPDPIVFDLHAEFFSIGLRGQPYKGWCIFFGVLECIIKQVIDKIGKV